MMKLNEIIKEKNKSVNLEKNKVLKSKFEILLQNKDQNILIKFFHLIKMK